MQALGFLPPTPQICGEMFQVPSLHRDNKVSAIARIVQGALPNRGDHPRGGLKAHKMAAALGRSWSLGSAFSQLLPKTLELSAERQEGVAYPRGRNNPISWEKQNQKISTWKMKKYLPIIKDSQLLNQGKLKQLWASLPVEVSIYNSLLNIKHNKELVYHLSLKVKTSLLSPKQIHLTILKTISEKDMHIFSIFKWQLQC